MESSEENKINKIANSLDDVSLDDMHSRHRKERKLLQAKIQALKKTAPKSDKKKRKEALDEVAKLEADLEMKQLEEMKKAEEIVNGNRNDLTAQSDDESIHNHSQKRITKAQKRRDKKAKEARQREEQIKASVENNVNAPKAVEAQNIQSKLNERQLALYNIPSDGDCLYNAVRHQLVLRGLSELSIKELRSETANYIETNKDSLMHYMIHPESGNALTDTEFKMYCFDIRNNSSWGGQIELKALSSLFKVTIEVLQGDGSPTLQGVEFGGAPLIITYHRHLYSLGEHYNSTIPLADDSYQNTVY